MLALKSKFVQEMGLTQSEVNEMVARYPPLLSKSIEDIEQTYSIL
jgi:hypothetical protein